MRSSSIRLLIIPLLLASSLTACSFPILRPTPTVTPTPTPAPTATLISTPTVTSTLVPTPSPVPPPTLTPTPLLLVLDKTPLPASLATMSIANAGSVSGLALWKESAVTDLAWSPDSTQLAIATFNGISILDVQKRSRVQSIVPSGGVVSLAYSPNGGLLAAGNRLGSESEGQAGNVDFWRLPSWQPLRIFYSYNQAVSRVVFSPNGRLFAIAYTSPEIQSSQDSVDFWNTNSWEISRTLQTGTNLDIAFSPDGRLLATTPDRYSVKIWQIRNGALLRTIHSSFTGAVSCLSFSPDGRAIATGHFDGSLHLWEVATGKLLGSAETGGVVTSLAYSPDGGLLASGDGYHDFAVHLWDPTNLQPLRVLEGHLHAVDSLAFSPNGQFLASSSYDGDVRLWGLRP